MKSSTTAEPGARGKSAPHVESAADPSIVIRAKMRQRSEAPADQGRRAQAQKPRPAGESGRAEPVALNISPEEGIRYYTAILGREPVLDPGAPDVFAGMNMQLEEFRSWRGDLSRILRGEIARQLQLDLKRQPSWRELMEAMTRVASRRIDEARQRLRRRNAA